MRRLTTLLLLVLFAQAGAAQTKLIDRIVVRINDRIATMSDFRRQLDERKQAIFAEQGLAESRRQELLANAGRDVLTEIYQELLLLSRSDQLGAKVTESDVDRALAQMRERMSLQTDEQLHQALASAGLTEDMLRGRLRQNLLVQEVMGREVHPRLRVEEDEQRRYYREHPAEFTVPAGVRLQEIIATEAERTPEAVAATAAEIHADLAAGAAIEEIARAGVAAGTTTAMVDLGWVNAGDLDADLEKAAWDLPVGGVTPPVRGRGGLHVVKLVERRAAALRPFDEVKEQIMGKLEQQRMGKEYNTYLRELEERAYIALKVPPEAEGFRGIPGDSAPPDASTADPRQTEASPSPAATPAPG